MSSPDPSKPEALHASGDSTGSLRAGQPAQALGAGLYVVSTPIGNLRDITLRALDVLGAVEEVLAEDTRVAGKLMSAYGLKVRLSPYHDHNGAERRPGLISRMQEGAKIALISDAGTPLVSDPGWKLAHEALEAGVRVFPIPGASAMLAGLVASGLPSDHFLFAGFLPPKSGARRAAAEALKAVPGTLIFYESGPRLAASLEDLAIALGGDRQAAVARELTKLFEETRRGTLSQLAAHYAEAGPPRGEIVLLVGPPLETDITQDSIDAALRDALKDQPTKAAASAVADALGLPKRDVYQRALQLKANG
ncbi:16S rRNA (cytidine(1402)-2'-O)-methyltransferase [Hyphomonas johnsonii]|uniref:Ribosomal RNA small subunit methyltransferase I n=1 Tax=Hyphomonas johnsonii MHS-2 TaxID=1280950 RepID=A0A059FSV1_9PROT|nr:16S rRNA (cytidine(1402)-2'-O)-methyltransferase [Hyphomonas johnsonii]KCZ93754.1 tetrapyrrole methylase family protein [Hyphomonas johnsonii MHS-2]